MNKNKISFQLLEVDSNVEIKEDYFEMGFKYFKKTENLLPGQFINVSLPQSDRLMSRPFSVLDQDQGIVKILYKVVGKGTKHLRDVKKGDWLNVLLPLGNHFPLTQNEDLGLMGGGIGVAPLYFYLKYVSRNLLIDLSKIRFYMGAQNERHLLLTEKIKSSGVQLICSTDDGTTGFKGTCLDALEKDLESGIKVKHIFTCGPPLMLASISKFCQNQKIKAWVSTEEVMGCGYGACMGCAIRSNEENEYKMVCSDGPVFMSESIDWNQ